MRLVVLTLSVDLTLWLALGIPAAVKVQGSTKRVHVTSPHCWNKQVTGRIVTLTSASQGLMLLDGIGAVPQKQQFESFGSARRRLSVMTYF